jgi:hypothetical protein
MKKYLILIIALFIFNFTNLHAASDRDRNWDFTTVTLNAAAKRVTIPQSGILFVSNKGNDAYIAFNATANSSAVCIPDAGSFSTDGAQIGASVVYGEYFTLFSASTTTLNWVILD